MEITMKVESEEYSAMNGNTGRESFYLGAKKQLHDRWLNSLQDTNIRMVI